jgi:parallel beta-helix repeat protein
LGATGVGTRVDPYVISNLVISATNSCISVTDTTAYFIIFNCILDSGPDDPAILFDNVENGQVVLCEISGGTSGVEFLDSLDCSLLNNTIYGCWIGIHMNMAVNCTTAFSKISSNHRGLLFENSSYMEVANNSIYSNSVNGLEFAWLADNNTVIGNSFGWNGVIGDLEVNAVDHGNNNRFDDGISIGNAWTDFNGSTPYPILGTTGTNDSFPELLEDTVNPVIRDQRDMVIDVETTGNILTWTASDEFPQHYSIELDGVEQLVAVWAGGDIVVDLDPLPVGSYSYVITVFDGAGNNESDVVNINVVSFVLGGIGTELVMIASGFTVAIFLVIIIIIKKLT